MQYCTLGMTEWPVIKYSLNSIGWAKTDFVLHTSKTRWHACSKLCINQVAYMQQAMYKPGGMHEAIYKPGSMHAASYI